LIPVDSTNWEFFTQCFKADSAYSFITIGNRKSNYIYKSVLFDASNENQFFPDAGHCYLYYDDLSLVKIGDPFYAVKKRVLCANDTDSIELSSKGGNHNFWWVDKQNPSLILGRDSVLKVKPSINTTYLVSLVLRYKSKIVSWLRISELVV
jgi:hypothetical protein